MPIYLDNQATTACDQRVMDVMLPLFAEQFGNPHSAEHAFGRQAAGVMTEARGEVAALIGADPREIVFTSGATEANNLAIKGAARFAGPGARRRLITLATEHKCVLQSVRDLAAEGFEPLVLPVRPDGLADMDALAEALRMPTLLVSVMAVNNETGILQDIGAIAALAHASGALFHSDIAQAAGKIPISVNRHDGTPLLDLASISAHKMYGPKGVGALYVRRRPRVRLAPLFSGGGQERGLRSGTLPAPLVAGFGEAARLARTEQTQDAARIAALRATLLEQLLAGIPGLEVNAAGAPRVAGNLSLRLPQVRALDLIEAVPELCVSTGSACTSAEIAPSHVLTAIGLDPDAAARTLRLGIGRFTSAAEIDQAAWMLTTAYARLAADPSHASRQPYPAEA